MSVFLLLACYVVSNSVTVSIDFGRDSSNKHIFNDWVTVVTNTTQNILYCTAEINGVSNGVPHYYYVNAFPVLPNSSDYHTLSENDLDAHKKWGGCSERWNEVSQYIWESVPYPFTGQITVSTVNPNDTVYFNVYPGKWIFDTPIGDNENARTKGGPWTLFPCYSQNLNIYSITEQGVGCYLLPWVDLWSTYTYPGCVHHPGWKIYVTVRNTNLSTGLYVDGQFKPGWYYGHNLSGWTPIIYQNAALYIPPATTAIVNGRTKIIPTDRTFSIGDTIFQPNFAPGMPAQVWTYIGAADRKVFSGYAFLKVTRDNQEPGIPYTNPTITSWVTAEPWY